MKYLCLICAETVMETMTEAEAARQYREYAAFTDDLKRNGHFISANRLRPVDTATTVRVRNGQVSVTDGPFAETKEQFGGYYVIEARDLNEAIQVAAKIPGARYGCVEIRPIAEDAQTRALGFDTPHPVMPRASR
ncbi:MAG: YciI family protein [Verrucomicrobiota bacterium]